MKFLNDLFIRITDSVSYFVGTPANIIFWLVIVGIWIVLGAVLPNLFTSANFLPTWFTSTGWNFPLNTVTTLIELYIGFLVAAAANRSEKHLRGIIEDTDATVKILEKNIANMQQDLDKTHRLLEKVLGAQSELSDDIGDVSDSVEKHMGLTTEPENTTMTS